MPYAEVSDIESRLGRSFDEAEAERAEALINDASAILNKLVEVDETDTEQAGLLHMVCCNMVCRAFDAGMADALGVSQMSMTAGVYTQSFQYANPSGDMYLTKLEKRLLGVSSGFIGSIRPMLAGDHDD